MKIELQKHEINEIKRLIGLGKSKKEISKLLNYDYHQFCYATDKHFIYKPNNNIWSESEIQQLNTLVSEGKTLYQILEIIKRPRNITYNKIRELNLVNPRLTLRRRLVQLREQGLYECRDCHKTLPYNQENFPNIGQRRCRSCSIISHKEQHKKTKLKIQSVENTLQNRLSGAKHRAKSKNLEYNLDLDFLKELFIKQEGQCFYTGKTMEYDLSDKANLKDRISIDKINPQGGYTRNNIVLCCWGINIIKNDYSTTDFIEICKTIAQYQEKIPFTTT